MSVLRWEDVPNQSSDNETKEKKLTPKQFWQVFESYIKCKDDDQAESLLQQIVNLDYPSIQGLITSLGFDYNHRVYLNSLLNKKSQNWLYNRAEIFRLLRQLCKSGFFLWIPKKEYNPVSSRARRLYPWLGSQELQLIGKGYDYLDEVLKGKFNPSQEESPANIEQSVQEAVSSDQTVYDRLVSSSVKDDSCQQCPHFLQPQVLGDIKDKTKPVDILFIGEAPHTNEVQQGKPFVGKSGQILRTILDNLPNHVNWAIWNASLCQVLPKKKDLSKALSCCRPKLHKAIQFLNPKVIILLGGSAYEGLYGSTCTVSELIGQTLEWNGRTVLVTYHPAAALHNAAMKDTVISAIEATVSQATALLGRGQNLNVQVVANKPDFMSEFVSRGLKLLDIQDFEDKVVYVFRDANGKRHVVVRNYNDLGAIFYYYRHKSQDPVVPISECELVVCEDYKSYKNAFYDECGYHSDISISTRHAIDYYLLADSAGLDQDYQLKIAYLDIEVVPKDRVTFPDERKADDPIVLISMKLSDGETKTWYLNNPHKSLTKTFDNLQIYNDEKQLLQDFLSYVKETDPDIITGWNIFFDLNYIFTRCERLDINYKHVSPVSIVTIDREKRYVFIGGRVVVDLLMAYKQLSVERLHSYSLGIVAQHELGYGKVEYEGPLMKLWDDNPDLFIEYNRQDVQLLEDLEKKLTLIQFLDQLRKLIKGTWLNLVSTSQQCDTMLVSYLEGRGLVARRKTFSASSQVFKGAFVFDPDPGIRSWVFDLDYASLYPNIIRTFNIGLDTFYAYIPDEKIVAEILKGNVPDYVPVIIDPLKQDHIQRIPKTQFVEEILNNCLLTPNGCLFLRQKYKRSTMYDLLDMLLKERKKYKKLKAEAAKKGDSDGKQKYHIMQWTYKIIANSFYGYLGFEHSRIHDRRVAASVTAVGRTVIRAGLITAEKEIESLLGRNLEINEVNEVLSNANPSLRHVIYGDSVAGESKLRVRIGGKTTTLTIKELMDLYKDDIIKRPDDKEEVYPGDAFTDAFDLNNRQIVEGKIRRIVRHKPRKKLYRIRTSSGKTIIVTEDHSLIVYDPRSKQILEKKPKQLTCESVIVVSNNQYDNITSIEEVEYNDYVYDLEVEDYHTFIANDIIVHNTDSIFITLENVAEKYDPEQFVNSDEFRQLEQRIDEKTRQLLIDLYKLDECYFELKNEWVARRFLQTAKKRYAYLTYPDNKLKVVGIEVRRSDQPPVIKEWLSKLLEHMLVADDLDPDQVRQLVFDFADKYRQLLKERLVECGKPMAANFNKENLPQCRAAKNWNQLEFEYFKQGTRGFYFHLLGIDPTSNKAKHIQGQLKDIMVPPEVGKVPQHYIIDDQKMVNDYWFRKVEAIFGSILPLNFKTLNKQLKMRSLDIPTW